MTAEPEHQVTVAAREDGHVGWQRRRPLEPLLLRRNVSSLVSRDGVLSILSNNHILALASGDGDHTPNPV
jgi:hypothetical protein